MDLSGGAGGTGANAGPDLRDIETEQLGFQAAAGEDKVRLVPSPWPSENLPSTTSSLLSVASNKGLVAAAGPDALVVATTQSLRHSFLHDAADDNMVKSFVPQTTMRMQRVSHVVFSGDETCLVVAAESGGGLAVYETDGLAKGNTNPAFELATDGEGVRQMLPNPSASAEFSGYCGIVTTNGKLLLADLKERKLLPASNGSSVFAESVSCACWSRLGKQIIAGLADGSAAQIDRQGVVKARIPEPPQLAELKDPRSTATPITSIFWLETDDFLIIHTPLNPPDSGAGDDSIYHIAHRNDKQSQSWTFTKLTDPCFPFNDRKPANHFISRLREWGSLNELLVVSSTASSDIGTFTRSRVPLDPAEPVIDTFAETKVPDQRRAALPMSGDTDTSPIGMALDLSATEKVKRPIPNDETLEESPIPLPVLYVLNHEGMLSMWWVIYNEAVRQSIIYPEMVASGQPMSPAQRQQSQQSAPVSLPQTSPPSLGTALGAAAATPAFGQPSFGAPSTPAFGGTSSIGARPSPWGGPGSAATGGSAFAKPTFGQPSAFGQSSFGQPSGIGVGRPQSVWGTPSQPQAAQQTSSGSTPGVFGGNPATQSPFMSLGGKATPSGFAALGGGNKDNTPLFGATSKPSLSAEPSGSTVSFGNNTSFGSGSTNFGVQSQPSFFGSPTPSAASGTFGKPSAPASREESMGTDHETSDTASTAKPPTQPGNTNAFGPAGAGGFKLGSTFKGDGTAKDDLPKPTNPGAGLFGSGFGDALGDMSKASSNSEGAAWLSGRSTPAIKKEPGTDEEPKLSNIPRAATPKQENRKQPSPLSSGDAPLPPDPVTWKPKPGALPPPTPPGFGDDFAAPKTKQPPKTEGAPLPPVGKQQGNASDEGSLAASPPVDLGQATFSEGVGSDAEAEGPPEEDEEWDGLDEDRGGDADEGEDDEEESDEDEHEDESDDEQGTPKIEDLGGLNAFHARITPASPKRGESREPTDSTTPATEKEKESYTPATEKKESYTPAGLPKAPIMFPPQQRKGPESPRSPSPQRSATSPLRPLPALDAPTPVPRPQQQSTSHTSSSTQAFGTSLPRQPSQTPAQPPQRIAVPPTQLAQHQHRPTAPPKPAEPEAGELEDEEDARVREILATPVEPTKDVPSFLAHQDYVASGAEKPGVGGQIERVYRDINSMVDTLALNARSLQGFVEGNRQPRDGMQRSRLDLENEEGWLLGESGEVAALVDGIETQLEDGRLTDVRGAFETLREEQDELNKLRTKGGEARKQIMARKDPERLAQQHAAPLPLETQTLQSELRQEVQRVQSLLAKAEEQLSVFRAELASLPSAQAGGGEKGAPGPTVEAVEKTIRKLTQMIERKSGDVDVLESKIRKLGGPAVLHRQTAALTADYEDELAASMKASRLSRGSPVALRTGQLRSSAHGSPRRQWAGGRTTAVESRALGTPGSERTRRSLLDMSEADGEAYQARKEARMSVLDALRDKVEARGPRVVQIGAQ